MGSSLFDEYGFVTEVDSETLGFVVPDHGTDSLAGVTEGLQAMAVGSVDGGNGGNGGNGPVRQREGREQPQNKKGNRGNKNNTGHQRYYAVRTGRVPGIYTDAGEFQGQLDGIKGCEGKSFKTRREAEAWLRDRKTPVPASAGGDGNGKAKQRSTKRQQKEAGERERESGIRSERMHRRHGQRRRGHRCPSRRRRRRRATVGPSPRRRLSLGNSPRRVPSLRTWSPRRGSKRFSR